MTVPSVARVTWDQNRDQRPTHPSGKRRIAERGFGTIIGTARSLILGAPPFPVELWAEPVKGAVYIKNRTPTDVLGRKTTNRGMVRQKTRHFTAHALVGFVSVQACRSALQTQQAVRQGQETASGRIQHQKSNAPAVGPSGPHENHKLCRSVMSQEEHP